MTQFRQCVHKYRGQAIKIKGRRPQTRTDQNTYTHTQEAKENRSGFKYDIYL